jgi:hypothetical protein
MAEAPRLKVYFDGDYIAACKQVRDGHSKVVWDENPALGGPPITAKGRQQAVEMMIASKLR